MLCRAAPAPQVAVVAKACHRFFIVAARASRSGDSRARARTRSHNLIESPPPLPRLFAQKAARSRYQDERYALSSRLSPLSSPPLLLPLLLRRRCCCCKLRLPLGSLVARLSHARRLPTAARVIKLAGDRCAPSRARALLQTPRGVALALALGRARATCLTSFATAAACSERLKLTNATFMRRFYNRAYWFVVDLIAHIRRKVDNSDHKISKYFSFYSFSAANCRCFRLVEQLQTFNRVLAFCSRALEHSPSPHRRTFFGTRAPRSMFCALSSRVAPPCLVLCCGCRCRCRCLHGQCASARECRRASAVATLAAHDNARARSHSMARIPSCARAPLNARRSPIGNKTKAKRQKKKKCAKSGGNERRNEAQMDTALAPHATVSSSFGMLMSRRARECDVCAAAAAARVHERARAQVWTPLAFSRPPTL